MGFYENKGVMDFTQIGRNLRFSGNTYTQEKLDMCLLYFSKGDLNITVSLATFKYIIAPKFRFL